MASTVTSEQETEGEASLQSKFEAQRNTLQVIVQSEFGLLSKLRSSRVLTETDEETIKADNTTIGRNQKLLKTIFERGKYHEFIDTLQKSGQTHVVNWINGNGVYRLEFGLDWPLTEREIEILDSNYDQLGEILNVKEELLHILFSKYVINKRQKDFISSKLTSCEANEAFLHILRQSSLKAYFLTVRCLRKLKEARTANILDNVAIAVPVHVNIGGDNVNEVETQLVKKVTLMCLEDTASCETAELDNFLARLRVSIIYAKKGSSIVLFVSCCTVDEFRQLCTIVDNDDITKVLEKLFNQLLQNFLSKVLLARITEADRQKAEKLFQRELLRDKKYDDHFQQLRSQLKYEEPMEVTTGESIEEGKEEKLPQKSDDPGTSASVKDEKQEDTEQQLAESLMQHEAEKYAFHNAHMELKKEKDSYEKSRMEWEKEKEELLRSLHMSQADLKKETDSHEKSKMEWKKEKEELIRSLHMSQTDMKKEIKKSRTEVKKENKELVSSLSKSGTDDMGELENYSHKTREFLEEIIDVDFGLLDKLRSNVVLNMREIVEIKGENTSLQRNILLLDIISKKKKFPELCEALKDTGQQHIANYLIACGERSSQFDEDWPLTQKEISILESNHEALVDILDTGDLIAPLYSVGVLNRRQLEFISSRSTSYEKSEALLEILRRCSLRSYAQTIKCLRKSDQQHIAEILERGGTIVRVDSTLVSDDLDVTEALIVEEMTKLLTDRKISREQAGRLLTATQLNIIVPKHGQ